MISVATIDRVRREVDIARVIGESVRLTRRGRSFVGLCPFHSERSPSFHVTPDRNVYHCFGCGEHGGVLDFVIKMESLPFPEAVRVLAQRFSIPVEEEHRSGGAGASLAEAALARRGALYEATRLAAVFFEQELRGAHPHAATALTELGRRGLTLADLGRPEVAGFRLGYAPSGGGLLAFLAEHGTSEETALAAGLAVRPEIKAAPGEIFPPDQAPMYGPIRDKFRHRLMFAVHDLQGRIVGYSGRALPDPRTGEDRPNVPKYLNSPETPIYRKGETLFGLLQARVALRHHGQAVVVEGNFDVVSLHARGQQNVVAPLGTSFTAEQAALLKRFVSSAVFLFDGDKAGDKALLRARGPAAAASLVALGASLPDGQDPDTFIRAPGGPEALGGILRGAQGLTEVVVRRLLDKSFASAGVEEQAQRVREVIDLVREEPDPSIAQCATRIANEVARRMLVRSEHDGMADRHAFAAIVRRVEQALLAGTPPEQLTQAPPPAAGDVPVSVHERDVLGVLLDYPALLREEAFWLDIGQIDGPVMNLIEIVRGADALGEALPAGELRSASPPSLQSFVAQRLAVPVFDEVALAREHLRALLARVKRQKINAQIDTLRRGAEDAGGTGNDDDALAALAQMQSLARSKRGLVPVAPRP